MPEQTRNAESKKREDNFMANKKGGYGWRGLTTISASLLAVAVGATGIINSNLAFLNSRLGTSNIEYVDEAGGDSDTTYFKSDYTSVAEVIDAKEALAEEIGSEGTVLMKNENDALPLSTDTTITLWGMNSVNPVLGGTIGSSVSPNTEDGQESYDIIAALEAKGFTLNQTMIDLYNSEEAQATNKRSLSPSFGTMYENPSTYSTGEMDPSLYTDDVLASADGTAAICVISRGSSEAADYSPSMTANEDYGDSFERPLALSDWEQAMIEEAKAHSDRVIVMINTSNPVEVEDLKNDDEIDAIMWVGDPGVYGFLGVADVISGEVSPSGHLTDTYAVDSTSAPAMTNFGVYLYTNNSTSGAADALTADNKADWFVVESEGIYDGYKYYETRYEDAVLGQGNATSDAGATSGSAWNYSEEVSYPFGYGLSYTTFEQSLDSIDIVVGEEDSTATVTVTNTGDVAGKSVAQLYVQAPYTEGGLEKSAVQLVGFAKTSTLEPGASETLTITFNAEDFASYDEEAVKADGTTGAWSLEAGDYYFAIGENAHNALNNILANKTGSSDGLETVTDAEVIDAEDAAVWTLDTTDIETYSEGVENQLQDMDINNLIEDTVTYTTRSDWTLGWETIDSITPTEEMMVGLTDSLYTFTENGDGETWGVDNGLTILDMMEFDEDGNLTGVKDLDDEDWDKLVEQITLDEAINFIEHGGDDVENIDSILLTRTYANDGPLGYTTDQVADYTYRWTETNSAEEYYTTTDDENATYSMATMPTDPVVAATFNVELAEAEGVLFGEDSLWSNESSLFAPGMNLHRTVYCARNHEYYSEDSVLTSMIGSAVVVGGESKGTMMEPKHFAFNHQESNRSGVSTFMNEQAARENELRCFQTVMGDNLAQGVMTAFNRAGTAYVGAYSNLLINIARNEWGYTGWFNTDMINGTEYMNWRDITAGGGGSALTSSAYDGSIIGTMANSKSTIEKDTYFQQMMKYNIKFWLYNLANSNAMNGTSRTTEIKHVLTWYQQAIYATVGVFAVLTVLFAILGIRKSRKSKKA